jgi:hypothetical protein
VVFLVFAVAMLSACSSDEPESETGSESDVASAPAPEPADPGPAANNPEPVADDTAIEMATIGALGIELPFPIPDEIPAPIDAEYIGENQLAAPYSAVQFSTNMAADTLRSELRNFAETIEARFDEAI